MAEGYLLINKPSGPTSHDIVEELRVLSGIKQIGHAGTLDPLAEGLLIVLMGDYTKKSQNFMKLPKEYHAILRLGLESDSHDVAGEISLKKELAIPLREDIENALERFRGEIKQIPPQFSAVKQKGKKAYAEARQGKELKLEPRKIVITKLETLGYKFPLLTLAIACSSGTYIRSLVRDIGNALGTGAILVYLRRDAVGSHHLQEAVAPHKLTSKNWINFLKII